MPSQSITLSTDQFPDIPAIIELPADEQPKQFAIFLHCLPQHDTVCHIVTALTQAGFGVMQIGPFTYKKTTYLPDDTVLSEASQYLEERFEPVSLLIGHSLAGVTAMLHAHQIDSLQAIAVIGTSVVPESIEALKTSSQGKKTKIKIDDQHYAVSQGWMKSLQDNFQTTKYKKIRKPILIMHAVQDEVIPIDDAAEVFGHVLHPKSFITLDDADHLLSKEQDARYAGNILSTWVQKYIRTYHESQLTTDKQVVTQTKESFTTHIVADQHTLTADEPESVGGHDMGPDPYDLLAASLGACTGMTLRMYADHKKWPLKEVRVHLQHQKIYAEDCSECDEEKNKIDHLERIIELEGDLSSEQKKRLVEIADKCPVHKTLSTRPTIKTTFREKRTTY